MATRGKCIVIVTVAGFLLVGFTLYLTVDTNVPYDADLRLPVVRLPDEENAFCHLVEAANALSWSPRTANKVEGWIAGTAEGYEGLEELLQQNSRALSSVERALRCESNRAPLWTNTDLPLVEFTHLGELLCLRVLHARRDGDMAGACAEALNIVRLGGVLEESGSGIYSYIIGVTIRREGLQQLRSLALSKETPITVLRTVARSLSELSESDDKGFRTAIQAEYMVALDRITAISSGRAKGSEYGMPKGTPDWGYLFLPNATRGMFARAYRSLLGGKEAANGVGNVLLKRVRSWQYLKMLFTRNARGKMLFAAQMLNPRRALYILHSAQLEVRATQLVVALACYKHASGHWPVSIDVITPEYITTVPADPFGEALLKYSRDKRCVYSVGEDGEDSGGVGGKDIIFEIEPSS